MLVSAFTSYHLKKTRLPSSSRRGWGWSEDGSEFTVLPPLAHPYLSVGRLGRRGTIWVSAFTSYHLKKTRLPSSSRRGRACLPVGRGGPKTR
jgi:hypothetical protein